MNEFQFTCLLLVTYQASSFLSKMIIFNNYGLQVEFVLILWVKHSSEFCIVDLNDELLLLSWIVCNERII